MASDEIIQELLKDERLKNLLLSQLSEKTSITSSLVINDEYVDKIKQRSNELEKTVEIKKGDLVIWKKGLKNRRKPEYNQPVIVMDILEHPLIAEKDEPGSANYKEPLSLVIGLLTENDDFLIFHYDKRRFEIFK